jgi:hypothetical protein
MTGHELVAIVGAMAAFAGCTRVSPTSRNAPRWADVGRRCSADARAFGLSESARAALAPDADSVINQNARWARIARRVPGGWGGFALGDGVPTIYLVDPAQRFEAINGLRQQGGIDGRMLSDAVRVRRARWDFSQLYDWSRYLTPLLANTGIQSVSIDAKGNRLVYGIATIGDVAGIERRLASLNAPCFLVAVRQDGTRQLGPGAWHGAPAIQAKSQKGAR